MMDNRLVNMAALVARRKALVLARNGADLAAVRNKRAFLRGHS